MAVAVWALKGATRPLPPLPRRMVTSPCCRSTSPVCDADNFPGARPRFEHQPDDGFVAAIFQAFPVARFDGVVVVGRR